MHPRCQAVMWIDNIASGGNEKRARYCPCRSSMFSPVTPRNLPLQWTEDSSSIEFETEPGIGSGSQFISSTLVGVVRVNGKLKSR